MAVPSPIIARLQYFALRSGASLLNIFDIEDNLAGARMLGSAMFRIDKRHRRRAVANIQHCFPEFDADRCENIAERSMQHFLQLGAEVLFTPRMIHLRSWPDRVAFHNLAPALDLMLADRPKLLLTGHFGNWELLGYALATVGLDMDAIARPLDNPLINDYLMGIRERQGVRIITKWLATDRMARIMQSNGTLAFIGDQNAGDKGLFVPFFGRLASAYKSIGLLAINFDAPVICGYARRTPLGPQHHFHYDIGTTDIIYPQDWKSQPDPLFYLTARYSRAVENMIRLAPEQYLWMHRRWKSRPRHEREGKPMPASLRRKLEALPWMTDALIRDLEKPVTNPNPR
ncbi:MAG: lysophospholipid acyltransferase family protein [Phycisphaerales bacterium]